MGLNIAPNYTNIAAGTTDGQVASEGSITVFGISCGGTAAGRVLIEERDGTTLILELDVPANGSAVFNIPFVASRGINVTTPANVTCTVFHSNIT